MSMVLKNDSQSNYPIQIEEKIVIIKMTDYQRNFYRKIVIQNIDDLNLIDEKVDNKKESPVLKNFLIKFIKKLIELGNNPYVYNKYNTVIEKTPEQICSNKKKFNLDQQQQKNYQNGNSGKNGHQQHQTQQTKRKNDKNQDMEYQKNSENISKVKWVSKFIEVIRHVKQCPRRLVLLFTN